MSYVTAPTLAQIRAGGPGSEAWEAGIEFLGVFNEHLRNRASAEAVFDRGGQYSDFLRDAEYTIDRMITRGIGESVGRAANSYGYVTQGKMTEAQWKADIQSVKPSGKDIQTQVAYVQKAIDAGFISSQWIDNFNGALQIAYEYWPELAQESGVAFLDGGSGSQPSADDFISQVTGGTTIAEATGVDSSGEVKAGNTSVDPSTYTGWMKYVYDNALKGSGNAADYAPSFVSGSDVHSATLQYIQQALDSAKSGSGSGSGSSSGTSGSSDFIQKQQDALDFIANSDLPADIKALYSSVVEGWDPEQAINFESIEEAFLKVQGETIDPYIQGLVNMAIQQLNTAKTYTETNRALQLEAEALNKKASLRNERQRLEQAGMTFTGEGVRSLGKESAYAQKGTESTIPTIGDVEGLIPAEARIISSSSSASYEKSLSDLALQAEEMLGTEGASSAGFSTVGSVTGSIPETQQSLEAGALSNLITQSATNTEQDELLDLIS